MVGIFESGLYDLDSTWAFTSLPAAQRVLDLNDVVNTIELRLDDIFKARNVAREAETNHRRKADRNHLDGPEPLAAERAASSKKW